ncbi:hypothetical protein [Micromonospora tulbaghiae]|uniref:hypothetical protein n=1 Tax=Micromonospora tulbaghiae TaxID=479978 RepID=UPI0013C4FCB4|nr:hypothetical protein [Micromonospora tulbaghiae]
MKLTATNWTALPVNLMIARSCRQFAEVAASEHCGYRRLGEMELIIASIVRAPLMRPPGGNAKIMHNIPYA